MKLRHWLWIVVGCCALETQARAQESAADAGVADGAVTQEAEVTPPVDASTSADALADAAALDAATSEALDAEAPVPMPFDAAAPTPPTPAVHEYGARAQVDRSAGPGEFEPYGTGSRLGVPLLELPNSVAQVDRRALSERGVVDLTQALGLVSGIMPTWQYGGFLHIRVRGFQAMTLIDGRRDPRALLADSAPQSGLYDVDRIEVLRGPSSTLYGYGAVGGVVNLIRRRPSSTAAYELNLGLGLPHQYRAHVGAQGPIGSLLSYRVDIGHVTHQNFRGARTERTQLTSSVRFAPSWRHALNVRVSYSFDQYNTDVGVPTVEDPERPGRWVLPPHTRLSNRYATRNDHLHYTRLEAAADYRWSITKSSYVDARAAVARDRYDYLAAEELNYVPAQGDIPAQVERADLYFARGWLPVLGQLEFHSEQRTGPLHHRFLVGYQLDSFGGLSDRDSSDRVAPEPVSFAHPVDHTPRVGRLRRTGIDHYRQLTHGLYAFDHIKLLERLIVTGGVRYDAFRSFTRREFVDLETGEETVDPKTGARRPRNVQRDHAVTGQVGVVYTPWSLLTTYASYGSSFMPRIVYPSDVQPKQYSPERGQQFEGGVRLRLARGEHRFDVDAAGYYIEKRDIVIPRGVDDFSQAGKAVSRGLDLTLRYRAPAYVELDGGYSLTAAEFKRFVNPDPISGDNVSLRGNQLDFAPRHSGNVWLRILPTKRLGFGVGSRFMGRQFADVENRVQLPRYALLDASVWFGNDHATFTLSANNLLDEHQYFTSAINTWATNPQVTPGPGREILGSLRLNM